MKLFQIVSNALRTWWLQDRIRVSPDEGRLLRLRPGDLLLVDGTFLRIKAVAGDAVRLPTDGPVGSYDAFDESRDIPVKLSAKANQLTVICTPSDQDEPMSVSADAIEIYPRRLSSE